MSARGSGLTYQWQVSANGGNTWSDSTGSGYNTATLDGFDVTEARLGRLYRCKIVDSKGNVVYSKGGEICLNTLTITKQPSNFKGLLGDEIVFSVKAKGKGLTYQWQYTTDYGATWYNSTGSGYNTRILDGFPITLTRDGRFYRCKVTDADGNVAYSGEAEIVLVTQGWYFEYDANGMRTQRTDGDTTYTYVYNGSLLSQMTKETDTLRFSYDAAGVPMTLTHNGTVYYYATNLQGDVIAIVNSSGDDVVRYTYDAWGNPLSVTGAKAATLGQLNPLRYRGYVYDVETGLYYLQSRYYNPEMGRFINADAQLNTDAILGYNMFMYCYNNPIAFVDSLGTRPISTMTVQEENYAKTSSGKLERSISCEHMKANTIRKQPDPPSVTPLDIPISPQKTMEEKKLFVDTMYDIGKNHQKTTGIPAALFAAQAAYESGYGTSYLARNNNNLFGFVGFEFESLEECIASYETTLTQNPRYKHLFGKDLKGWVYGIGPAGYCPEDSYGDILWSVVLYWDLDERG